MVVFACVLHDPNLITCSYAAANECDIETEMIEVLILRKIDSIPIKDKSV